MLYSSGTTGRPKGVKPLLAPSRSTPTNPLMQSRRMLYGMGEDRLPVAGAALSRRAAALHHDGACARRHRR